MFRPSSDRFGSPVAAVLRCRECGHGSVAAAPDEGAVKDAYQLAADPVSLREEAGQVATATRALVHIEGFVNPGALVDVGCWTGSFLEAAAKRGWDATGVEPSLWAAKRAAERGLRVVHAEYGDLEIDDGSLRLVSMCDVLEHLPDPGAAVDWAAAKTARGGALYATVPDAGSLTARILGRRWWSVLPMHLQYFTRSTLRRLLADRGFEVRTMRTHAKVFTAAYYAERLGGYSPALERASLASLRILRSESRLVAPDFRDRIAVIATR